MNFNNGSPNGYSKNIAIDKLKNCLDESDLNGTKSKQAFGKDFKGFYWSWRTGKIGIKSIDGNGFFQGDVDEEFLNNKGYQIVI